MPRPGGEILYLQGRQNQVGPHVAKAYSTFDPALSIDNKSIPALGPLTMEVEEKFKFLGRLFRYDLNDGPQEEFVRDNFLHRQKHEARAIVSVGT